MRFLLVLLSLACLAFAAPARIRPKLGGIMTDTSKMDLKPDDSIKYVMSKSTDGKLMPPAMGSNPFKPEAIPGPVGKTPTTQSAGSFGNPTQPSSITTGLQGPPAQSPNTGGMSSGPAINAYSPGSSIPNPLYVPGSKPDQA
ncbi:hypothetical protein CAC42_5276 [Sphaceloma murrayae]|uniref:Uncharacterized protein n=1 Tax=Sphaceloma murrayae TaxID=2082308 RepID=A0A2K1QUJ5_9PEZI|nr:hypothetical protein CAC42_5276 [Sphaceloma murrayae]